MATRTGLLLALAIAFRPVGAAAQSVDQVIAKHFEALGGIEKLKEARSYRMTGRLALGQGMEATFVRTQLRPNMSRMDFTVQGVTGVQAYDGTTAWMHMPFMGQSAPEAMPPDLAKVTMEESEFDGPLIDYAAKGNTVELVGKESVEGTETFKLKLTRKSGEVSYYYFDAEYYLPLKTETRRTIQGREMALSTTFGDYKAVEGIMIPHSIQISGQGPAPQQLIIERVEVNIQLDVAQFKMPAASPPKE
jgi:outer membrane lipoprotein-sorting protein